MSFWTPANASLFARLAVFAGGFTLEAAEAVCDAQVDTLAALVDRSMVRCEGERFNMLETIGDFAREQLAASAERAVILDRHAAYFEAMAERAHSQRWHQDKQGLDELGREHDNLRAALDHLQSVDAHRALRLAGALGWFWHLRSHFSEGRPDLRKRWPRWRHATKRALARWPPPAKSRRGQAISKPHGR